MPHTESSSSPTEENNGLPIVPCTRGSMKIMIEGKIFHGEVIWNISLAMMLILPTFRINP